MTETIEEKRARIIADVAKARMLQLQQEEESENSRNNKLSLNEVLGVSDHNGKGGQGKLGGGQHKFEIAAHQKEFGARKFIKP